MGRLKFRVFDGSEIISRKEVYAFISFDSNGDINTNGLLQNCVMQSTGLFDINGVEIFEGDIVKFIRNIGNYQNCDSRETMDICIIIWQSESCSFRLKYEGREQRLMSKYRYEVIGNIHEDKILLSL